MKSPEEPYDVGLDGAGVSDTAIVWRRPHVTGDIAHASSEGSTPQGSSFGRSDLRDPVQRSGCPRRS